MPIRDGARAHYNGQPYVVGHVNLKMFTTSGTTTATGAITFGIPAGTFNVVFSAFATAVRNTTNGGDACFAQVRTVTASTVAVQVFEAHSAILTGSLVFNAMEPTSTPTTVLLTVLGN